MADNSDKLSYEYRGFKIGLIQNSGRCPYTGR